MKGIINMNARKAKKLRKLLFKKGEFRNREYGLVKKTGQVINIGVPEQVGTQEKPRTVSKHRLYRHCKRLVRNCSIKGMEKEIFNS